MSGQLFTFCICSKSLCGQVPCWIGRMMPCRQLLDRSGNPIHISAVVVYKIVDSKKAALDEKRTQELVANLLIVLCSGEHAQPMIQVQASSA